MQSELNSPRENVSAAIRIAALFVLLAAGVWMATRIMVRRADANFAAHSAAHIDNEVRRIRGDILQTEAALDAAVARAAQRLAAKPSASRADTFAILRDSLGSDQPQRGIRVVTPNGEALAWWGEDLRTSGNTGYEFDATNLYVVRSRAIPRSAISVQAFARIPNGLKGRKLFDFDDDCRHSGAEAITSSVFFTPQRVFCR